MAECHFVSHRDSNLVSSYFGLMGAWIIDMYYLALLGSNFLRILLDSQFCPIDVCIYLNTTSLSWLLQLNITLNIWEYVLVVREQAEQILGIMPVNILLSYSTQSYLFQVIPPTVLWAFPHEPVDQEYAPIKLPTGQYDEDIFLNWGSSSQITLNLHYMNKILTSTAC